MYNSGHPRRDPGFGRGYHHRGPGYGQEEPYYEEDYPFDDQYEYREGPYQDFENVAPPRGRRRHEGRTELQCINQAIQFFHQSGLPAPSHLLERQEALRQAKRSHRNRPLTDNNWGEKQKNQGTTESPPEKNNSPEPEILEIIDKKGRRNTASPSRGEAPVPKRVRLDPGASATPTSPPPPQAQSPQPPPLSPKNIQNSKSQPEVVKDPPSDLKNAIDTALEPLMVKLDVMENAFYAHYTAVENSRKYEERRLAEIIKEVLENRQTVKLSASRLFDKLINELKARFVSNISSTDTLMSNYMSNVIKCINAFQEGKLPVAHPGGNAPLQTNSGTEVIMPDPETGERPVTRYSNCSEEYVPTAPSADVDEFDQLAPESPVAMCNNYIAELNRETAPPPAGDERAEGLSALQAAVGDTGPQAESAAAAVDIVAAAMNALEPAELPLSSTRRRSRK